jgi:RecA/RadA recombinase
MASTLFDKIKKNSTIKETASLNKSKIYGHKDMIQTPVPMINVALSGSIKGGLTSGTTVLAGPSKHFKSAFSLIMAAAFQAKYPEGIVLFYDSEFGTPQSYFKNFGVDTERVVHTPISDIEMLKHDIMNQLKELTREDKVLIIVDSIGQLASKKEVDDAIEGKSVADMTRAKAMKSFFRMVTPHLNIKDIPLIVINHTYMEIGMFPKAIVSGGTGVTYAADNIWILGRQQEKDGTEIQGYHFIINVEKSRFVREKSKIPITVTYEGGVNKWSGLMDIAIKGKYLGKPLAGWYQLMDKDGKFIGDKYRAKDIVDSDKFWEEMFKTTDFEQFIEKAYMLESGTGEIVNLDFEEEEVAEDVL